MAIGWRKREKRINFMLTYITIQFDKSVESALITVLGVNGCGVGPVDYLAITATPYTGLNPLESGKSPYIQIRSTISCTLS